MKRKEIAEIFFFNSELRTKKIFQIVEKKSVKNAYLKFQKLTENPTSKKTAAYA